MSAAPQPTGMSCGPDIYPPESCPQPEPEPCYDDYKPKKDKKCKKDKKDKCEYIQGLISTF